MRGLPWAEDNRDRDFLIREIQKYCRSQKDET